MARFPTISAEERTPTTDFIEQGIRQTFAKVPSQVEWKDASGTILGPYAALPYTDDLVKQWFILAFVITRQEAQGERAAVLAVQAEYDAPLAKLRRPMQDDVYDEAVGVLGRDRVDGLVHLVSLYVNGVMLTNVGGDGDVPPKKEGIFTARKNPTFEG